jgi:UrcA family protein
VIQRGTRQLLVSGLAAVVLGLGSVSSFASTSNGAEPSMKVSYGELDLSKPAGAQALYKRIRNAAYIVCGGNEGPIAAVYTTRTRCFRTAVNEAVAKVNAPLLTALHTNKTTRVASK